MPGIPVPSLERIAIEVHNGRVRVKLPCFVTDLSFELCLDYMMIYEFCGTVQYEVAGLGCLHFRGNVYVPAIAMSNLRFAGFSSHLTAVTYSCSYVVQCPNTPVLLSSTH